MSDDTHGEIALAIASARAGIAQLDNALQNLGDLMVGLLSISATPTAGLFGPTLNALTLSNATFVAGAASDSLIGNIQNRTAGAALAIVPSDGRVALNGAGDQLLVGLTAASAGTFSVTLLETLARAPNSPRPTTLTLTVSQSATTPNPFSFPAVTGAALTTLVQSSDITLTGLSAAAPYTALGTTEVSTNRGAGWATTGTYNPGDPIRVRGRSSAGNSVKTTFLVNVGGVMGTVGGTTALVGGTTGGFDVTTVSAGVQVPTDILSDVVLWGTAYDPATLFSDDGVTAITEGGAVYRANDKSAHAYHLKQATSGARPIYSATSFFGTPGLSFDGVNDFLRAQGITLGTDKFSLFLSIVPFTDAPNDRYVAFAGNLGNADYADASNVQWLADSTGTDIPGFVTFNAYRNGASAGTAHYAQNTPYRVAVIYDGTNGKLYVNNAAGGTSTSSGAIGTTGDLFIGAGWFGSPGSFGKCIIQSWCIARGDITSGQRAAMDTWLSAPTGVTLPSTQAIAGLKALQTTGSMSAGSTTLTVASAAGFAIGDHIIVEPGGETDQWHGVGGMWPSKSAASYSALLALTSADLTDAGPKVGPAADPATGQPLYLGYYAWISGNSDGHQGETWQYTGGGWIPVTYSYWAKARQIALLATITNISGNTITLNTPSVAATTGANVYFNNSSVINGISGAQGTTFTFPDPGGLTTTYAIGSPSIPTGGQTVGLLFADKNGWTIDGIDKAHTRLKTPKGVPCTFFSLANCTNFTIKNIGMDGNFILRYAGMVFWHPNDPVQSYNPFNPKANQMTGCNGCVYDTCETRNVMQQGFGAAYSDACWAYDCNCIQDYPFTNYTQWLILWSDCGTASVHATGGSKRCTITCSDFSAGTEMFRSFGVTHEDFTGVNAFMSINSGDYCIFLRPKLTYTTTAYGSELTIDYLNNPCISVNTNIQGTSGINTAGSHNEIIDAWVVQQGTYGPYNDSIDFIAAANAVKVTSTSTRRTTHIEDHKGYFECPAFNPTSQFRGASMTLNGAGSLVDNIRINGTTRSGSVTLSLAQGSTASGAGTVQNSVLPDKGDGTPSIDGGDVRTNNITNATWTGGG